MLNIKIFHFDREQTYNYFDQCIIYSEREFTIDNTFYMQLIELKKIRFESNLKCSIPMFECNIQRTRSFIDLLRLVDFSTENLQLFMGNNDTTRLRMKV